MDSLPSQAGSSGVGLVPVVDDGTVIVSQEHSSPTLGNCPHVLRKVPPVPKFGPSSFPSMAPPPSRACALPSLVMGVPPDVPTFWNSSEEKKVMGPPPPRVSPSAESKLASSVEEHIQAAAIISTESSIDQPERGASEVSMDQSSADSSQMDPTAVADLVEDPKTEHLAFSSGASTSSSSSQVYTKPSWSASPGQPYKLEVFKEGIILGIMDVSEKGAYMFGRSERCDVVLEHPTVSRHHAVLQYNSNGESFIYDLGSTHGTFINKCQVKGKEYVPLHVGDIIRFGHSSRLHAFQGPLNLMPEEGSLKKKHDAQTMIEAVHDRAIREASLVRGRRDAMASDGISWGLQEDAVEEEEENPEEVTWQTFKGELTEKQQKSLEKIQKRNEKLSNLKKENDAIQAKEISQGGLTQGQQTQIARNEQRMEQIVEELESMEDSLNESIQESINGRSRRRSGGKKKSHVDDDEDMDSSEDEFYDRAKKLQPQKKKEILQTVETAESLLDKRAALTKEIEKLHEAIRAEEQTSVSNQETRVANIEAQSHDPLDQFMTSLSSKILEDKASHLQKQLDSLTKEVERVGRLLKIADPTGEGLKKWEGKKQIEVTYLGQTLPSRTDRGAFPTKDDTEELVTKIAKVENKLDQNVLQRDKFEDESGASKVNIEGETQSVEDTNVLPGLAPPVRLGAPIGKGMEESKLEMCEKVNEGAINFITYKDRKNAKGGLDKVTVKERVWEGVSAKVPVKSEETSEVDLHIADSVALLLRHKRGLLEADNYVSENVEHNPQPASLEDKPPLKYPSKKRKKQGPTAKLSHLMDMGSNEDWVPPAGQTGDGRTALNDKYGY